ncbi:IS1595 family transposase [Nitrobacter sp. JJSN]|uniref:IS1595 family transposase n=1 Tax=Nitrobacter sp. JJSN TaxID=3453033 RepID=UPI003F7614F6
MSQFNAAHFQAVEAAREYLEALRWGGERVCPHCGSLNSFATKKPGVYRCREKECRKDFSVTTKSVMESSHIKLHIWLQAFYLMASSKKGVSSHQLHRALGVTYKTAWFLSHRIREAMRNGGLVPPMGGEGKVVEADETYFGPTAVKRVSPQRGDRPYQKGNRGPRNKRAIVSLVERGGSVRSFHVAVADAATVAGIVSANIHYETRLHTDESRLYTRVGPNFAAHETVKHTAGEYARGDVNTNSVEGFFSIFKRGMKGVYQHCAEKHLHRYLSEYDFRYNYRVKLGYNDGERADLAIKAAAGKRLTYRQSH